MNGAGGTAHEVPHQRSGTSAMTSTGARPISSAGPVDPLALRPDDADTPFMGGSTADTPTTPEHLRASDAERDHAVSELRNEFAEGRLSHETFIYRMQSALDARSRGQLAGLFTDLPSRRPGLIARIRAALRGENPASRESQPDGKGGVSRTQQVAGPSYGLVPKRIPPAPPSRESPSAQPSANPGGLGGLPFPRGVRDGSPRRRKSQQRPGAAGLPAGQRDQVHHRPDPRLRPVPDRSVGVTDARFAGPPRGRLGAQRPGIAQRHQAQRLARPRARPGPRGRPGRVRLDGVHHPGRASSGGAACH